jgi:Haem-binding domain
LRNSRHWEFSALKLKIGVEITNILAEKRILVLLNNLKQNIMKNLKGKGLPWQMLLVFLFAGILAASGQDKKDQAPPIPDDVLKIFKASCMKCHNKDGRIMARIKLNFSNWNEYDPDTVAKKASKICEEITEAKMPPKSARESNPELIPTKEQVELICKWSGSFVKPGEGK